MALDNVRRLSNKIACNGFRELVTLQQPWSHIVTCKVWISIGSSIFIQLCIKAKELCENVFQLPCLFGGKITRLSSLDLR